MQIEIRPATESDMPAIHSLVRELAIFEKAPEEHTLSLEKMLQDFKDKKFHVFAAIIGEEMAGMAFFFPIYSTWKGLSYYLEDIIVTEKYRRNGIGSLLFEEVLRFCKEKKAKRLKWQVLDWNQSAIDFYNRYNCQYDSEWLSCRLTKEQISELV